MNQKIQASYTDAWIFNSLFLYSTPCGAMPIANSTAIATRTTSSEMMNPCSIGFAPERQRDLKSVFRPYCSAVSVTVKNYTEIRSGKPGVAAVVANR